jgi:hypothetical protein
MVVREDVSQRRKRNIARLRRVEDFGKHGLILRIISGFLWLECAERGGGDILDPEDISWCNKRCFVLVLDEYAEL